MFQNTHQNCYFELTDGFTSYPDEKETLLYDGLTFFVTKFEEIEVETPVQGSEETEKRKLAVVHLYND